MSKLEESLYLRTDGRNHQEIFETILFLSKSGVNPFGKELEDIVIWSRLFNLSAFTMAANQIPSSIYFNPEWSYRYNSEFFLELPVRSKKDFLRLTLEPYALHKANPYLSFDPKFPVMF